MNVTNATPNAVFLERFPVAKLGFQKVGKSVSTNVNIGLVLRLRRLYLTIGIAPLLMLKQDYSHGTIVRRSLSHRFTLDPIHRQGPLWGRRLISLHHHVRSKMSKLNELCDFRSEESFFHPLLRLPSEFGFSTAEAECQLSLRIAETKRYVLLGQWERFIFAHSPELRAYKLMECFDQIAEEEFLRLLGVVWTDPAILGLPSDFLIDCLARVDCDEPGQFLMTKTENEKFGAMADEVEIFRAHGNHNSYGMSWTLDAEIAKLFGLALGYNTLSKGCVDKDSCICMFGRRGHSEIIVQAKHVENIEVYPLEQARF